MSSTSTKSLNQLKIIVVLLMFLLASAIGQPLTAVTDTEQAASKKPDAFGGAYSELEPRRQQLIENWVKRFNQVTGQKMEAGAFYDNYLKISTRTTFDAVTHALMTTSLADESGKRLGDALSLVEQVDTVRGMIPDASGDRQFRMYVLLKKDALDILERSKEFKRGSDNSVYHKGYPISYRQQGGVPSTQISISLDHRHADIDVDYRSASFPKSLVNGHLSSANSDVRAGNNYDRHTKRWVGFENWWHSFFGVSVTETAPDEPKSRSSIGFLDKPRAGNKDIEEMMEDFLKAWLIDGDIIGAVSYVSPRAYACMAEETDDPFTFDHGMAPFLLLNRLKAAHDTIGPRKSLDGVVVGFRLNNPGLKEVDQKYHQQFVIYSVPDDIAAKFNCESRLTVGDPKKVKREYGNYYGATFLVKGPKKSHTMAFLWSKDDDYWKIISWRADPDEKDDPAMQPPPPETATAPVVRVNADPGFVEATHTFLESWLVSKNYDAAFRYLSAESYDCYNLLRNPEQPAALSTEDAGQKTRANLEKVGNEIGKKDNLDDIISAADPFHPSFRIMEHPYSATFTLTSLPNIFIDVGTCKARASRGGERFSGELPPDYGKAFALNIRFKTIDGDAPVLRTLWVQQNGNWRIIAYDVELP